MAETHNPELEGLRRRLKWRWKASLAQASDVFHSGTVADLDFTGRQERVPEERTLCDLPLQAFTHTHKHIHTHCTVGVPAWQRPQHRED